MISHSVYFALSEESLFRRIRWIRRTQFVAAVVIGAVIGIGTYILLDSILKTLAP